MDRADPVSVEGRSNVSVIEEMINRATHRITVVDTASREKPGTS